MFIPEHASELERHRLVESYGPEHKVNCVSDHSFIHTREQELTSVVAVRSIRSGLDVNDVEGFALSQAIQSPQGCWTYRASSEKVFTD